MKFLLHSLEDQESEQTVQRKGDVIAQRLSTIHNERNAYYSDIPLFTH